MLFESFSLFVEYSSVEYSSVEISRNFPNIRGDPLKPHRAIGAMARASHRSYEKHGLCMGPIPSLLAGRTVTEKYAPLIIGPVAGPLTETQNSLWEIFGHRKSPMGKWGSRVV